MEAYLNRYCQHISKLTDGVDISETLKFIDSDDFNTREIINAYEGTIDIASICCQVKRPRFMSGCTNDEKREAILQFFINLHNYAKNLIINFDIYSCKTIGTSSTVMRDNVMLIPHYRRYMERLLGYEFDLAKAEWVMKMDNGRQLRSQLGATCILVALGQRQLNQNIESRLSASSLANKWNCERCGSSNELESPYCSTCSSVEGGYMWRCPRCTCMNDETVGICEVCSNRRMAITPSNIGAVTIERKWKCAQCTFLNDITVNICKACFIDRRRQGPSKDLLVPTGGQGIRMQRCLRCLSNKEWKSDTCKECDRLRLEKSAATETVREEREREGISSERSTKSQRGFYGRWECTLCSTSNTISSFNCVTCYAGRPQGGLPARDSNDAATGRQHRGLNRMGSLPNNCSTAERRTPITTQTPINDPKGVAKKSMWIKFLRNLSCMVQNKHTT